MKRDISQTKTTSSGSVSTTQEYNITDFAIAQLAKELGKKEDYKRFSKRSVSYRKLFDTEFKLLRPKNDDGSWLTPYNPETGANFVKNLGFIEGNAWQYTFMVSHDAKGLMKLMGGLKAFSKQLQNVFDKNQFDMANEPDIAYPYLFNYVKGEEWRTQEKVSELLEEYFKNSPDGLPGNDDTGTMSAWAVFSMMGIYPINPAQPIYALAKPKFDKITINLDSEYYPNSKLTINTKSENGKNRINNILIDGKKHKGYFISHDKLTNAKSMEFILE